MKETSNFSLADQDRLAKEHLSDLEEEMRVISELESQAEIHKIKMIRCQFLTLQHQPCPSPSQAHLRRPPPHLSEVSAGLPRGLEIKGVCPPPLAGLSELI